MDLQEAIEEVVTDSDVEYFEQVLGTCDNAELNSVDWTEEDCRGCALTPLGRALVYDRPIKVMQLLLEKGADPQIPYTNSNPAPYLLDYAVTTCNHTTRKIEFVKLLLGFGANPDARSYLMQQYAYNSVLVNKGMTAAMATVPDEPLTITQAAKIYLSCDNKDEIIELLERSGGCYIKGAASERGQTQK